VPSAEDAAALVDVDYRGAAGDIRLSAALRAGAALAHRGKASNLLIEFRQSYGDIARCICARTATARGQSQAATAAAPLHRRSWRSAVYDVNEDRLTLWSLDAACARGAGFS